MSQYPKEILGNKIMEDIYSFSIKARNKVDRLVEKIQVLETENALLKSENELIKSKLDKHETDIVDLKKPRAGGN